MFVEAPSIQNFSSKTVAPTMRERFALAAAAIRQRNQPVTRRRLASQLGRTLPWVRNWLRRHPDYAAQLKIEHGNFQGGGPRVSVRQIERAAVIADMQRRANLLRTQAFLHQRPEPPIKEVTPRNALAHQRRVERAHELRSLLDKTREEPAFSL